MRLVLLGLPHDLHDFGVARIDRASRGRDGEGGFAIDRAGDDGGTRRFCNLEWFASQECFIHDAVALDDGSIHWRDVVRINNENVTDGDVIERHIADNGISFPMRDGGHPLRQSA